MEEIRKVKNVLVSKREIYTMHPEVLEKMCKQLEETINKDKGMLVRAPEVIVSKEFDHVNSVTISISYILNSNSGTTKISFKLAAYNRPENVPGVYDEIYSDFPVTVKVIENKYGVSILTVWSETIYCYEVEN